MTIALKLRSIDGRGGPASGSAIEIAASKIGCEVAVLQAVLEVESGGDAFDGKGRLIILPEKHIFWRYLPKALRNRARVQGLAHPKWSRSNYKGLGGKGSDRRWDRFEDMARLHEDAAAKSLSYGKPQIMGFNHKICGYGDVQSFVLDFARSEDAQDAAFIEYLVNVGLAEALREKDFREIARRYNGPGQVDKYSGMMARAYKRITGNAPTSKNKKRFTALRIGSQGYQVKALQERLSELGYHTGIDGDFGPATRRSVVAFQVDHGLDVDGMVTSQTNAKLKSAVPHMLVGLSGDADSRQNTTNAELRERSKTAKKADNAKRGAIALGASAAVAEGSEVLSAFNAPLSKLEEVGAVADRVSSLIEPLKGFVSDNPWLCLAVIAGVVWWNADGIFKRRMHDHKNWRNVG